MGNNTTSRPSSNGNFTGKPERRFFIDDGYIWIISYLGGDGNDVLLTLPAGANGSRFVRLKVISP